MKAERILCRTEGCGNTILLITAQANDGYCMPCVQKRAAEQRNEFIRRNRREEDPYAGITDVVEIIRIMHTPRPHDPLVVFRSPPKSAEELYSALNAEQAERLMTIAAEAMRVGNQDFAENIGTLLATITDYSFDRILSEWVGQNHFWPAIVFRKAGATIRDAVIDALESGAANANHALSALAWVGDAKVQETFRRWETQQPRWRRGLYVGPAEYARVAGWELAPQGRRNLFHDECWAITPVASGERPETSLRIMQEVDQSCPWCKRALVHLLELDSRDKRFEFLGVAAEKLPILTCDVCTCFGFMFSRVLENGEAELMPENERPEWLPEDFSVFKRSPWKDERLHLHQRRAIHAVDWCMPVTISQVGGLPSWVQDATFPKCPNCSATMKFIAQVDNGQFPGCEGIYYAFLCSLCRVTATTYQQT